LEFATSDRRPNVTPATSHRPGGVRDLRGGSGRVVGQTATRRAAGGALSSGGVKVRPLSIAGAWEFTPVQHADDRGVFLEWYKADEVAAAVGHPLDLVQANHSISRRGTVRGVHFADVPPSQAKYVYCPRGAVLDVVVDVRVGSPTFGRSEAVLLDETDRRTVYLAEGLGHAFVALADDTAVTYLCSTGYNPGREHAVNPLDPDLALPWPEGVPPLVSPKDLAAPTLAAAREAGALPDYAACQAYYAELNATG
jgi:dTDP-4-dehydrorhamnose 3,5-epimerase